MVQIRWLGHACFWIRSGNIRIVTDPFRSKDVGYQDPCLEAEIVTVSHDHFDHNQVGLLKGSPQVVKGVGEHLAKGIKFLGIHTYHDPVGGRQRGTNTIFRFELEGIKLAHLGDLGHVLERDQLQLMQDLDLVMIPVGGYFTIDAIQAWEVLDQLKPKIAIPMHYKTKHTQFPIHTLDRFLARAPSSEQAEMLELAKADLPKKLKVVVLEYTSPASLS